jgi:hypothetical protein
MSKDFMMDILLQTMFIVRREEDNDGNIQELAVESHEYISIQAMQERQKKKRQRWKRKKMKRETEEEYQ